MVSLVPLGLVNKAGYLESELHNVLNQVQIDRGSICSLHFLVGQTFSWPDPDPTDEHDCSE